MTNNDTKTYGKTVVILSGGMDSTTLLYWMRTKAVDVAALSFFYGQRHQVELDAAQAICLKANIPHELVDLGEIRDCLRGSSQTDNNIPVPEGHYADPSMKVTVVPNRNMIMLSVAAAYCISYGMMTLAYAAHSGDHPIYPDCRPEFVEAMGGVLKVCHYEPVRLVVPFGDLNKADILDIGQKLEVPYEMTYSCYNGGQDITGKPFHCGRCGACVERKESFQVVGVKDPTKYELS